MCKELEKFIDETEDYVEIEVDPIDELTMLKAVFDILLNKIDSEYSKAIMEYEEEEFGEEGYDEGYDEEYEDEEEEEEEDDEYNEEYDEDNTEYKTHVVDYTINITEDDSTIDMGGELFSAYYTLLDYKDLPEVKEVYASILKICNSIRRKSIGEIDIVTINRSLGSIRENTEKVFNEETFEYDEETVFYYETEDGYVEEYPENTVFLDEMDDSAYDLITVARITPDQFTIFTDSGANNGFTISNLKVVYDFASSRLMLKDLDNNTEILLYEGDGSDIIPEDEYDTY